VCCALTVLCNKTAKLIVENSAQTTFRFSPVSRLTHWVVEMKAFGGFQKQMRWKN
jgi:hypothetical protein